MVNSLLGSVPAEVLYRLDVNFNIEETSLDSMIGRTAHILFLENEELLKMIVARYKVIFNWANSSWWKKYDLISDIAWFIKHWR